MSRFPYRNIVVLTVLVALVSTIYLATRAQADVTTWPELKVDTQPTQTDLRDIQAVLRHSTLVTNQAAVTGDTSLFSTVFVDDASAPLHTEQKQRLLEIHRLTSDGQEATVENAGWLTYMDSVYQREYTERALPDEATAADQIQTQPTPLPRTGAQLGISPQEEELTFEKVIVDVDHKRAYVVYNDGISLREAFLIKTSEGWKIAGGWLLRSHG